jgi:hypothetical protein
MVSSAVSIIIFGGAMLPFPHNEYRKRNRNHCFGRRSLGLCVSQTIADLLATGGGFGFSGVVVGSGFGGGD